MGPWNCLSIWPNNFYSIFLLTKFLLWERGIVFSSSHFLHRKKLDSGMRRQSCGRRQVPRLLRQSEKLSLELNGKIITWNVVDHISFDNKIIFGDPSIRCVRKPNLFLPSYFSSKPVIFSQWRRYLLTQCCCGARDTLSHRLWVEFRGLGVVSDERSNLLDEVRHKVWLKFHSSTRFDDFKIHWQGGQELLCFFPTYFE